MTTAKNEMSIADYNVQFMRKHLEAMHDLIESAAGNAPLTLEMVNVDGSGGDHYDDESVFYYHGSEFRGLSGIQDFIDLTVGPCVNRLGEIVDIFGGEQGRVCLVIREQLERPSDGEKFDYVRNVIYKIENDVIRECWVADAPPIEMSEFLADAK